MDEGVEGLRARWGGGVELHSFHRGCASANQVTPSSVPGNWEGRISSVLSMLDTSTAAQRPVCTGGTCVHACVMFETEHPV